MIFGFHPDLRLTLSIADIEYRELQKAFTLLNKRLKPLEHFQPTPNEFKDLCYLLSAKSVHDAPSFKNWEGVTAARERLVESFGKMVEGEREESEGECCLFCRLTSMIAYTLLRRRERLRAPGSTGHDAGASRLVPDRAITISTKGHACYPLVSPRTRFSVLGSS